MIESVYLGSASRCFIMEQNIRERVCGKFEVSYEYFCVNAQILENDYDNAAL